MRGGGELLIVFDPFSSVLTYQPYIMKGGETRLIAVGCTLRRLVAKAAALKVHDEMSAILSPIS